MRSMYPFRPQDAPPASARRRGALVADYVPKRRRAVVARSDLPALLASMAEVVTTPPRPVLWASAFVGAVVLVRLFFSACCLSVAYPTLVAILLVSLPVVCERVIDKLPLRR